MIPGNALAVKFVSAAILTPDSFNAVPLTEDYEQGGKEVGDSSEGNQYRDWKGELSGSIVTLFPVDAVGQTTAIDLGIVPTEFTFTFDQSMNPVIAYISGGTMYFRYFDSISAQIEVIEIPGALSPFVTLDDKRFYGTFTGTNDVLLFYILNGNLYYRMQRESYSVERLLYAAIPGAAQRISKCGMDNQYRLHIEIHLRTMGN